MFSIEVVIAVTCAALLAGCGATTLRVGVGPTIDSRGRIGVEATLGVGIGWPLDFSHRSQHYAQAMPWLGGGLDGRTGGRVIAAGADLDYIHWPGRSVDVRFGGHFAGRWVDVDNNRKQRYMIGGQLGVMPIVAGSDASWLLQHFCLGPELRASVVWGEGEPSRGLFALPLVAELNLLAAGD